MADRWFAKRGEIIVLMIDYSSYGRSSRFPLVWHE
jgi:hypothetical protein